MEKKKFWNNSAQDMSAIAILLKRLESVSSGQGRKKSINWKRV